MKEKPFLHDTDNLDTTKAASATDCTGIIQTPPKDDYEYESYNDVYEFLSPDFSNEHNVKLSDIMDAKKTYKKSKHEKYQDNEPPLIL